MYRRCTLPPRCEGRKVKCDQKAETFLLFEMLLPLSAMSLSFADFHFLAVADWGGLPVRQLTEELVAFVDVVLTTDVFSSTVSVLTGVAMGLARTEEGGNSNGQDCRKIFECLCTLLGRPFLLSWRTFRA